jgi:hypothetical protein
LIRFGTDVTLKFSAAASQYLLAIGSSRRALRAIFVAAERRAKKIAGASAKMRPQFSRMDGVTRGDPPLLAAENALHVLVVEFESHARGRGRDDQSKSDKNGFHWGLLS